MAKQTEFLNPTAAEAAAILWVFEKALTENFTKIILESNSKIRIDTLSCPLDSSCWKIHSLSLASLNLALQIPLCLFN